MFDDLKMKKKILHIFLWRGGEGGPGGGAKNPFVGLSQTLLRARIVTV